MIVECSEIIDVGCNLKQFDGLTWLTLTPHFTTDLRHWTAQFWSLGAQPTIRSTQPGRPSVGGRSDNQRQLKGDISIYRLSGHRKAMWTHPASTVHRMKITTCQGWNTSLSTVCLCWLGKEVIGFGSQLRFCRFAYGTLFARRRSTV